MQMLNLTVFVHISKCIKIVQVKIRIPEIKKNKKISKKVLTFSVTLL